MANRKCVKGDSVTFQDDTWTVKNATMTDKRYRTYYELRNNEDTSEVELVRTDRFVKLK